MLRLRSLDCHRVPMQATLSQRLREPFLEPYGPVRSSVSGKAGIVGQGAYGFVDELMAEGAVGVAQLVRDDPPPLAVVPCA